MSGTAETAPDDLASLGECAQFFGVSAPTLKRWIDAGAPVVSRGDNGVAYQLSLRAVAGWRSGQKAAELAAEAERLERDNQLRLELLGTGALTAGQAEPAALTPAQRAAALQEEVARTKLAQLRGELVAFDDMALRLTEALAMLRTRMRQLGDTAGPELGLGDVAAARLAQLVDDALADTAEAIGQLMDAPEAADAAA